jgi:hypothetical protein
VVGRRGMAVGVMSGGGGRQLVVQGGCTDGAVLVAWLNRSERGRSGLSAMAQRRQEWWRSGGQ